MKNVIIFSVDKGNDFDHLARETVKTQNFDNLQNAIGAYGGIEEKSYVVPLNAHNLVRVLYLAKQNEQNCIMVVDGIGHAYLSNTVTGAYTALGYLRQETETIAKQKTGYTLINDRYYVTE